MYLIKNINERCELRLGQESAETRKKIGENLAVKQVRKMKEK